MNYIKWKQTTIRPEHQKSAWAKPSNAQQEIFYKELSIFASFIEIGRTGVFKIWIAATIHSNSNTLNRWVNDYETRAKGGKWGITS